MSLPASIHQTLRGLRSRPGLNLAVVACIALGIAAMSSMVSLFSATSLRPLPFPDGERLVRVWLHEQGGDPRRPLPYGDFQDIDREVPGLERLEGAMRSRLYWVTGEGGRRVEGEAVSPGYLQLLGVEPALGRRLGETDAGPDAPRTMMLSFTTWTNVFGGDPEIVGSELKTQQGDWTVVGVMPPGFAGTIEDDAGELEFWVPLHQYRSIVRAPVEGRVSQAEIDRNDYDIWAIGRLTSLAAADTVRADLRRLGEGFKRDYPDSHETFDPVMEPMGENWRAGMRGEVWLMNLAALMLLAIAVVNVSALLVARTVERQQEFAVRTALGASQARLMGQILREVSVLAVVGGLIGLAITPRLLEGFVALSPITFPDYMPLEMDLASALISAAVLAVAAFAAGLAPAWLGLSSDPQDALRQGVRGGSDTRGRRLGRGLVIGEVAVTLVLAFSAALLLHSQYRLQNEELGFDAQRLIRVGFFPDASQRPERDELVAYYLSIRDELATLPGVESVSALWATVPIGGNSPPRTDLASPVLSENTGNDFVRAGLWAVDGAAMDQLGLRLLAGRTITATDLDQGRDVAVVSESLAGFFGGEQAALGQTVQALQGEHRIVGVVVDASFAGATEGAAHRHEFYVPLTTLPQALVTFAVRAAGDPAPIVPQIRRRLAELAPTAALDWVGPATDILNLDLYGDRRFIGLLVTSFSLAALLLTGVGLAGILADRVARDFHRFGLMQALGATRRHVLAFVIADGLRTVGIGLAIGLAGAVVAGRLMEGLLFGIGGMDLTALAAAAGVLVVVALLASTLPARRATRIQPMDALRSE